MLLVAVVAVGYQRPERGVVSLQQSVSLGTVATASQGLSTETPSVDEIVATDVAASLTERANLPVAPNVANTAVSLAAKSELAQTNDTSISKPQIVQSDSDGRTIQTYVTKRGDTVGDVARQFGVSENTIKWANNLASDALEPGRKLKILPVTGVVYKVESGDTVNSIAQKYKASAERLVSYNDLEESGPRAGKTLIIPGGVLPNTERPGYNPPSQNNSYGGSGSYGGSIISTTMASASAGNRYAYGNCTWYAYNRRAELGRPVGSFWGNANTWAVNARAAGMTVNNSAAAGAVLVDTAGYYGHVAIVESVKSNGDVVVSEMNNYAYGGFGVVNTRTISAGQAGVYQYIH